MLVHGETGSNSYSHSHNRRRIVALTIGSGGRGTLYSGFVLTATSIATIGTGKLDLTDGAAIVDYGDKDPIDSIQQSLTSGYNGGAWNGSGIISSTAQFTPGSTVGFAEASDIFGSFPATFAGQSVDSTSIVMHYTLYGDANLDRSVDTVDFNLLASNFGGTGKRWSRGDFNYEQSVDTVDFNLLAANFSKALPAASAAAAVAWQSPAYGTSTPFSHVAIGGNVDLLQ